MNIEIPSFLSHLKTDDRGYPVPYFVPVQNGKPNFRFMDVDKQSYAAANKLCGICGKKIKQKSYWFIGGKMTLKNRVSTDIPNHEKCARYALKTCPYLFHEFAQRVETEGMNKDIVIPGKPMPFYLIVADKSELVRVDQHRLFKFRPLKAYEFNYVDKKLTETGMVIKTDLKSLLK